MWHTLYDFYRSEEWERFRQVVISERVCPEDHTLYSEYSGKALTQAYDVILHHKVELTPDNVNDYAVSLNPDLIQIVSHAEHNIIHERFGSNVRRVYLVYGSPCSGKSTWVSGAANPDDLILDIDAIWGAICTGGLAKPERVKQNVFALRDSLLDQIKTRRGKWRNAYIIGGYPFQMERRRMCDVLGAEPVYIECEKSVCLLRATEKPQGWTAYVEDWWEKYQPEPPPGGG